MVMLTEQWISSKQETGHVGPELAAALQELLMQCVRLGIDAEVAGPKDNPETAIPIQLTVTDGSEEENVHPEAFCAFDGAYVDTVRVVAASLKTAACAKGLPSTTKNGTKKKITTKDTKSSDKQQVAIQEAVQAAKHDWQKRMIEYVNVITVHMLLLWDNKVECIPEVIVKSLSAKLNDAGCHKLELLDYDNGYVGYGAEVYAMESSKGRTLLQRQILIDLIQADTV